MNSSATGPELSPFSRSAATAAGKFIVVMAGVEDELTGGWECPVLADSGLSRHFAVIEKRWMRGAAVDFHFKGNCDAF
ncbi:hypothetical protein ACFJIS_15135 [Variovorax boronicumulans]|uniref:hypothetical protein n=1 Tax=Variovorax boronicumulans TaxID=436515 RepID=UPI0036F1E9B1